MIGKIFKNNIGLEFKIISKDCNKSNSKHIYYNIEFIKSGYKDSIRSDSIKKGLVKDKLNKTLYSVGIIGYANTKENYHEYKIWSNMISRCYNIKDKCYKWYGEKGITVSERWHRFDYFLNDIPLIQGYDEELFKNKELKLDKDILFENSDNKNKIYSLETCMWITDKENQRQRTLEYNIKYKKYAIFPDGHEELILNVTDFCKNNNLHRQNVNLCLNGKQKSTKGFKFYKK